MIGNSNRTRPNPGPQSPNQKVYSGAYDFLNSPAQPPKQPSFFARRKGLILVAGGALVLLFILAIAASLSTSTNNQPQGLIDGPTTTVPLTQYDETALSMNYAQSLKININEKLEEDPSGWFIQFADGTETSPYDIAVNVSSEPSIYLDGEEAVSELLDTGVEPSNVVTSDIVLAGLPAKKTVGEFVKESGEEMYVVYTTVQSGEKYITISGTYQQSVEDITNSFDAMAGSIRLK